MPHRTPLFFASRLTANEQGNPHKVLEQFMFHMDLPYARKIIHQWLTAACNKGWFNKECPANLLFFYEHLTLLIEAAWLLQQADNSECAANLPLPANPQQLPDSSLYCPEELQYKAWHYFPRHLSQRDFYQPYRVFEAFFKYQSPAKWQNTLHRLLHQSLSTDSFETAGLSFNILTIKKHLCKLVEASQLIVLRRPTAPATGAAIVTIAPGNAPNPVTLSA